MSEVSSNLPYQKVIWKENGCRVSRIVPVAWISKGKRKTFLAWPNKVNVQKDISKRSRPEADWRLFRIVKLKEYYGKKSSMNVILNTGCEFKRIPYICESQILKLKVKKKEDGREDGLSCRHGVKSPLTH